MSFLLFIGFVGGLLSFGIKGLLIGPVAVLFVSTLGSFWLPLYGFKDPSQHALPSSSQRGYSFSIAACFLAMRSCTRAISSGLLYTSGSTIAPLIWHIRLSLFNLFF